MITFNFEFTDKNEKNVIFKAEENGRFLGNCCLELTESFAVVSNVSYSESSPFIVEGLLKAAFNFAANRSYYIGRCTASGIDVFLKKMKFVKCDGYYENDIPTILMGCCGGGCNL